MEAHTDEHGINRVKMTDSDGIWIDTGKGETIFIFRGHKGVKMTLWAKKGVTYTKRTHSKTIVKLEPKQDY